MKVAERVGQDYNGDAVHINKQSFVCPFAVPLSCENQLDTEENFKDK